MSVKRGGEPPCFKGGPGGRLSVVSGGGGENSLLRRSWALSMRSTLMMTLSLSRAEP